jgi:hypothetical protein
MRLASREAFETAATKREDMTARMAMPKIASIKENAWVLWREGCVVRAMSGSSIAVTDEFLYNNTQ